MRTMPNWKMAALTIGVALTAGLFVSTLTDAAGPKQYTSTAVTPSLQLWSNTAKIQLKNTSRNRIAFSSANVALPAGLRRAVVEHGVDLRGAGADHRVVA